MFTKLKGELKYLVKKKSQLKVTKVNRLFIFFIMQVISLDPGSLIAVVPTCCFHDDCKSTQTQTVVKIAEPPHIFILHVHSCYHSCAGNSISAALC